jgi:hypothetical protein
MILWPNLSATHASISCHSARDADAYLSFCSRAIRVSTAIADANLPTSTWLLASDTSDPATVDQVCFRTSSLASLLEEMFDDDTLKGMIAQGAVVGTSTSPRTPGSAIQLLRQSVLAAISDRGECRYVAGGAPALRRALLSSLRLFNNAHARFGAQVAELVVEREAVQAVLMRDGSTIKAPLVISSGRHSPGNDFLAGLSLRSGSSAWHEPGFQLAEARFVTGTVPKFAGVDPTVVASGAILRLKPSLNRLVRGHVAFVSNAMDADPCMEVRVIPRLSEAGPPHWEVLAYLLYLPDHTIEGPWTGNRRDKLVGLMVRSIEHHAPGFSASVESAVLERPHDVEPALVTGIARTGPQKKGSRHVGVPEFRYSGFDASVKGLICLEPSMFSPQGDAGLASATIISSARRGKAQKDA